MVKRSTSQLYRTTIFLAQFCIAAFNHLINKCDQKIEQVKNQIIKHQIRKKNRSNEAYEVSVFFGVECEVECEVSGVEWLECVVLGKFQVPSALQHRFKIFSGIT